MSAAGFVHAAPPFTINILDGIGFMHSAPGKQPMVQDSRPRPAQCRMTGVVEITLGIAEHGLLTNPVAAHERRF